MADIDDELLALAGGSDDEEQSGSEGRVVTRSPSPTPPPVKKPAAKPTGTKKTPAKKGRRRGRQDDSDKEEEGEASPPSSPNSLQSASMDESDSETEVPQKVAKGEDIDEKYPVESLYVSLAEKAQIMKMREVERETILAERREENQKIKQNRILRQLVTAQEEKEKEQQRRKRSADDADLEEGSRKTARQRTRLDGTLVGETSTGIGDLRRARAEKSDRQRRREEDRERQRGRMSPDQAARDQEGPGDADDEWLRSRTPEHEIEAKLADFERLRIGRNNFAEICFKPGLEDTLIDCYVRVLGKPDRHGDQRYHILAIKGFTTGRAYAMGEGKRAFVTDQHVIAGLGKKVEPYPFIAISSGRFTEDEVQKHRDMMADMGLVVPKLAALDKKLDILRAFVSRKLTDREITDMIDRRNMLRRKYDPAQRESVEQALQEAKVQNNQILTNQLEQELASLGKPGGLAFRTSLTPAKPTMTNSAQQERLAELNRENRRRNVEAVRKAQLKERHRAREIEAAIARGEAVQEDPSRRLKTKAKFVHDVNDSMTVKKTSSANGSGASTPANGTPKLGAQKHALLPQIAKLQEQRYAETKGIPTIHKPLLDDDIIGALDLDIDIDID